MFISWTVTYLSFMRKFENVIILYKSECLFMQYIKYVTDSSPTNHPTQKTILKLRFKNFVEKNSLCIKSYKLR